MTLDDIDHATHELNTARANYRATIVAAYNNGTPARTIANHLNVSHQTIYNIIRADRATRNAHPISK